METEVLLLNQIPIQVYLWGKRTQPPLLFIHGWMDSGINFHYVCQELSQKYFCIAPDLRGHGKSGRSPNPLGYFFYEYVAEVDQILKHFAIQDKVPVVGHSMGGNILSLFAGTFPERVSEFINIEGLGIRDMAPSSGPARVKDWLKAVQEPAVLRGYPSFEDFQGHLKKRAPRMSDEVARHVAGNLLTEKDGKWYLLADSRHTQPGPYLYQLRNIIPFWQNIKARCLFIQGDRTEMGSWMGADESSRLNAEIEDRLKHFPPSIQRVVMKDCGHMIHYEDPKGLAGEISRFLGL